MHHSDHNVFDLVGFQAPLVIPGKRGCLAIQDEEDRMVVQVCLEVLEVLDQKVSERPVSLYFQVRQFQELMLSMFLQGCLELLVWMDLTALADLKVPLELQVRTSLHLLKSDNAFL